MTNPFKIRKCPVCGFWALWKTKRLPDDHDDDEVKLQTLCRACYADTKHNSDLWISYWSNCN